MDLTEQHIDDGDTIARPESGAHVDSVLGNRYRATRLLNSGKYAETLLATDLSVGETVVVKAMPTGSSSGHTTSQLEQEAELLRQVESRWFASPIDFGFKDDSFYFVMPFIPGAPLQSRLRERPLEIREAVTIGCCLLAALKDLHYHRVLHLNIKPTNVIVDIDPHLKAATLVDIGLAGGVRLEEDLTNQPLTSALYMSPEQAGSIDCDVGEPSDLYSAGVVLYECLSGRPPFTGDNVGEILFEQMTAQVPELRSLGLAVPRALDELVLRLLRKDPQDRYQSAEAALGDLRAIADSLDRGEQEPPLVIGMSDRRRTLTEPGLVARADELTLLDDRIERTCTGHGGLVFIEGESGDGKSRLLAELAQRGASHGLWVLQGTRDERNRSAALSGAGWCCR